MKVKLAHAPNPDIRGGYWGDSDIPAKRSEWIDVPSVEAASATCRSYLERYRLGGGNWVGGQVVDGKTTIGRIAFNGNFFAA